ncbi:MAG: LytTR family transcriptional regulator [Roseitalea sp.]|jgi:hypothetical protein|nr:LytTR family transcriptional regulator [Roseitalea sp.]MBO6723927.1 LytTR family transcriptional regulator [Roseitalea sp.]MBO6745389.1 LytTR family transcriptional regulator [Roseitalea sp.]
MTKVVNDTALDDTALAATLSEARSMARQTGFWLGLAGAGIVVGLVGPFGTYDTMPQPARIAYWLAVVATTYWIGYLTSFAVASALEGRGAGVPLSVGIGAIAASLPVTAWLAGLHMVVFATPFWSDAVRLFPYVAAINMVLAALMEAGQSAPAGPVLPDAEPRPHPAWLDGLPTHLGRDLVLLQAQDHYVQARTALGETLVRTTIQEAADALGDHGLRVHRSWWVARSAIRAHAYRNGAPVLLLHDGQAIPIGRTYRRAVRQALG